MIPESPSTPTLTGTLAWQTDWLVLHIGPWKIAVADVEEFDDDGARAHLHGWSRSGAAPTLMEDPPVNGVGLAREGCSSIDCASRDEAFEVIRALLAVRGVAVPPRLAAPAALACVAP